MRRYALYQVPVLVLIVFVVQFNISLSIGFEGVLFPSWDEA